MKCQFCGYDGYDDNQVYGQSNCPFAVKLYRHYRMYLCDRCVDKINSYHNGQDIDEYWEDEDAIECGFKPFPKGKEMPDYKICCYKELEYIKIHLQKLWSIENEYYDASESYRESLKEQGEFYIKTVLQCVEKMKEKYEERVDNY